MLYNSNSLLPQQRSDYEFQKHEHNGVRHSPIQHQPRKTTHVICIDDHGNQATDSHNSTNRVLPPPLLVSDTFVCSCHGTGVLFQTTACSGGLSCHLGVPQQLLPLCASSSATLPCRRCGRASPRVVPLPLCFHSLPSEAPPVPLAHDDKKSHTQQARTDSARDTALLDPARQPSSMPRPVRAFSASAKTDFSREAPVSCCLAQAARAS
jgi:hypothetical protein